MNIFGSAKATPGLALVKKIGEQVKISIDVENMALSNYVGFRLNYPSSVIFPMLVSGAEGPVQVADGNLFEGRAVDLICNYVFDPLTGDKYVYVSKVIKTGNPVATPAARVLSMDFICEAAGSGLIELVGRQYGNLSDGSEYGSTADPLDLTLQAEAPQVLAQFKIVVE